MRLVHVSCVFTVVYERIKHSINGVVSEPRAQVSAQNTYCRECTLVASIDMTVVGSGSNLDCHYCCKVAFLS